MNALTAAPTARSSATDDSGLLPLAVISNGGSTQNKVDGGWLDPILSGEPQVHHLRVDSHEQVAGAVGRAAELGVGAVVVNGGDGTADLVFAALLNQGPFATPPPLVLLSAGKTNMTAHAWCGTADKATTLRSVLAARRDGTLLDHAVRRPILALDRGDGSPSLRGAFFGAADVVNGILYCRRRIYPLKLPNAVSHAAAIGVLMWRSLFAARDTPAINARWTPAGSEEGRFFFVGVTTLDRLILGLKPNPREDTGPMRYLSLRPGPRAVLGAVSSLLAKSVSDGAGRTVRGVRALTLNFDGAYTLDGELYESRTNVPLTLTADDSLTFIRFG